MDVLLPMYLNYNTSHLGFWFYALIMPFYSGAINFVCMLQIYLGTTSWSDLCAFFTRKVTKWDSWMWVIKVKFYFLWLHWSWYTILSMLQLIICLCNIPYQWFTTNKICTLLYMEQCGWTTTPYWPWLWFVTTCNNE